MRAACTLTEFLSIQKLTGKATSGAACRMPYAKTPPAREQRCSKNCPTSSAMPCAASGPASTRPPSRPSICAPAWPRSTVSSLAFADHAPIPARYTADGEGVSPPLQWTGVPAAAASLLLIVEDADSPTPQPLVHAIVVGLPRRDGALAEAALPSDEITTEPARRSAATRICRRAGCRPIRRPGHGVHRYAFQVFALEARRRFRRRARSRGGARGDPRPRPGERLPDRHLRAARHLDQTSPTRKACRRCVPGTLAT